MRRLFMALTALCAIAPLQVAPAQDAYPRRLVRLIVPFAPGGNTDVVGRLTANYMQKALNVNVVVENRAGAGGINGTDAVAKAMPDGYTLCICGIGPITVSPATEKLPYDPLKDLAPISLINTNPLILVVNPQVKANSAAELAALSKSLPEGLSYGTVGSGGLMQFAAEIFRVKTGSKFTSKPYRGGALATGRGGYRRGPARVLEHVGCNGPARSRHSASPRYHDGPAQPAHPEHTDANGVRTGRLSSRILECAVRAGRHAAAHR
jgi:tripartite-type tricarboxylate transporter receptor subunit TctC